MTAILIGGSPGTGKSEVAEVLGTRLKAEVISMSDLARRKGCISARDDARDTDIIDEGCLVEAIMDEVEGKRHRVIVEGHYIDLVPYGSIEHAFVLRTHPDTLRERLLARGYSKEKVFENVEAEVIGVCQMDAIEAFGEEKVFEIDTTDNNPLQVADVIIQFLKSPAPSPRYDWMELLENEGRLDGFVS
jgi:adenylate kinase